MPDHIHVFLSSTTRDLADYRAAVAQIIADMHLFTINIENFQPTEDNPVQVCYDKVKDDELFIGVYAYRYGYILDMGMTYTGGAMDGATGITHMEHEWSLAKRIPIMLFVMDDKFTWNSPRDSFSVLDNLANYHKLDYKGLETLIYTYLGDWISRQKSEIGQGIDGSQERLAAAEALKARLEQILKGEAPHDIFIRWKPIEEQPIGWQPDLNDGVLINIRPFMTVQDVRTKGASVLRSKPNIKWTKDRGRDVETAPWYHLGPQYGGKLGDRINDHHLTLADKQAARDKKGT